MVLVLAQREEFAVEVLLILHDDHRRVGVLEQHLFVFDLALLTQDEERTLSLKE